MSCHQLLEKPNWQTIYRDILCFCKHATYYQPICAKGTEGNQKVQQSGHLSHSRVSKKVQQRVQQFLQGIFPIILSMERPQNCKGKFWRIGQVLFYWIFKHKLIILQSIKIIDALQPLSAASDSECRRFFVFAQP